MNPHHTSPRAMDVNALPEGTVVLAMDGSRDDHVVIARGKRAGRDRRQAEWLAAQTAAAEAETPGKSRAELERMATSGNRAQRRRAEQALRRVQRKAAR